MLRKNMICRIEITDINNLGYGVGKIDGVVVFVAGAVDGDILDAHIIKVNKTYAVARIDTLHVPSRHRIDSTCRAHGCGGCAYGSIRYAHELQLKENYVRHAFRKAGLPDVTVHPVASVGKTEQYRNKAQYPVATDKNGRLYAGFFAPRSHRVVAATHCGLQPRIFGDIVKGVLSLAEEYGLSAYDEASHTGLLRHIYLRQNADGSEILLTLVLNGRTLPHGDAIAARLMESFPALVGIVLNANEEKTNVICGDTYILLSGRNYINDTLCGAKLRITAPAFYQVNHDAAELLYAKARELARIRSEDTVLDLYCGIGSIGLAVAGKDCRLFGVEIIGDAVACARENAVANGFENAEFLCADAADIAASLPDGFSPDVVILDPPRGGCDISTLDLVSELDPARIVYISCNPDTLARDCEYLRGVCHYEIGEVYPVDLFPRTGHVESVVCLTRSDKAT